VGRSAYRRPIVSPSRAHTARGPGHHEHDRSPDYEVDDGELVWAAVNVGGSRASTGNAAQIDGVIALAMACERAQVEEQPARLLGWL